jgi:hypothetical protein
MKCTRLLPMMTTIALLGCAHDSIWNAERPFGTVTVATLVSPTDLYRVVLQQIDGAPPSGAGSSQIPPYVSLIRVDRDFQIHDARSDFSLPPGEHLLSLTAVVDRQLSPVFSAPPSRAADATAGELRLVVEEGKHYFIAAKVDELEPERWVPVVYKVEAILHYADPAH